MKISCIVVAAGKGTRANLGYNKAYYDLGGRTVLETTLCALIDSPIDEIVPVIGKDDAEVYARMIPPLNKVKAPVFGGDTRRDSVQNGLHAVSEDTDIVLVHDAARPFVTREIIEAVIRDASEYHSAVICTKLTDTVKRVDGNMNAVATEDRRALVTVQTPQGFDFKMLKRAYESLPADEMATDDAYLFEKCYGQVHLTTAPGADKNKKLTNPEDFIMTEEPTFRTGTGYDVHRLVEGRRLILCGEDIPYEKGLLGHSDADVALHALMDAMLGAAALGDIGKLFPDKDPAYEGISSLILLGKTNEALLGAGYAVSNCDVTIVCQKPKLAPYIEKMRVNIADTLKTDVMNVSVKATTTEHLGFEGAGEGISAQAAVLIRRVK